MKFLKKFESTLQVLNFGAMSILCVMILLTAADVIGRYIFNHPIYGAHEYTQLLMICMAVLAMGWCTVQGGQLKVDLLMSKLPLKTQKVIDFIVLVITLGVYMVIGWQSIMESIAVKELLIMTSLLKWPEFIFYIVVAIGCALLCISIIFVLIRMIIEGVKK